MENKSGNLFLGIIGVSTLIVAIIGATFAYFSASAGSNEDAITTTGADIKLEWYEDTTKMGGDLIPVQDHIAIFGATDEEYIAEDEDTHEILQCLDDNRNTICSIYDFGVKNAGLANQDVFGKITIQSNTFKNLRFAIYRTTPDGSAIINPDGTSGSAASITPVIKATYFDADMDETTGTYTTAPFTTNYNQAYDSNAEFDDDGKILSLAKSVTNDNVTTYTGLHATLAGANEENTNDEIYYRLIMWIHETGTDQTTIDGRVAEGEDGMATIMAGITFTTSLDGGTGITGIIGKASKLNAA